MIEYNPKDWFTFIFKFHKADTFRKLVPLMLAIAVYSAIIATLELRFIENEVHEQRLKNISLMYSILSFVISLLLVFRTNSAYERWWEGRKMWGSLVNVSRNFAVKCKQVIAPGESYDRCKELLSAFPFALMFHLRNQHSKVRLHTHLSIYSEKFNYDDHVPNQIVSELYKNLHTLKSDNKLNDLQIILLDSELRMLLEVTGACERIKNTPIPFSYSAFIKKFIFFYVMTMPIAFVFQMGYYIIPVSVFVLYVLASLEILAEEIENPFGTDANDLPLDAISKTILKSVNQIMD